MTDRGRYTHSEYLTSWGEHIKHIFLCSEVISISIGELRRQSSRNVAAFPLNKIKSAAVSSDRLARLSLMIWPALLNNLSLGTLEPGMARYFLATRHMLGYRSLPVLAHHFRASDFLGSLLAFRYFVTSAAMTSCLPAAVLVRFDSMSRMSQRGLSFLLLFSGVGPALFSCSDSAAAARLAISDFSSLTAAPAFSWSRNPTRLYL